MFAKSKLNNCLMTTNFTTYLTPTHNYLYSILFNFDKFRGGFFISGSLVQELFPGIKRKSIHA